MAEPEWSAAYKGLCLYMARVLQPAWEEELMVPLSPGSPALRPNILHHMLMVCPASRSLHPMPSSLVYHTCSIRKFCIEMSSAVPVLMSAHLAAMGTILP